MQSLFSLGISSEDREIATWLKRLYYENWTEVQARLRFLLDGRKTNQSKGLRDECTDRCYLVQCLHHSGNIVKVCWLTYQHRKLNSLWHIIWYGSHSVSFLESPIDKTPFSIESQSSKRDVQWQRKALEDRKWGAHHEMWGSNQYSKGRWQREATIKECPECE